MGGGGAIVHGFRRWFHRRSEGSTSNSNQSCRAGEGEADDGSSDLEVIEDPDLLGLRAIRVPKRKMPLPVESHRKVSDRLDPPPLPCLARSLASVDCGLGGGGRTTLPSSCCSLTRGSREISCQGRIFLGSGCSRAVQFLAM
jgi:hypothetical protein